MNKNRILTVVILASVAILSGCSHGNVRQPRNAAGLSMPGLQARGITTPLTVGIDLYHGQEWAGLVETLTEGGFRTALLDNPIGAESLRPLDVLMIADAAKSFSDSEINAISRYVRNGGRLLCAQQAWSWVYKEYGNKPIETLPLNQLGKKLNFWITEKSIGAPKYLDTDIMAGLEEVKRTDWWPSQIDFKSEDASPIVRDENHDMMGGSIQLGNGMVIVYGHIGLLKDNPQVLKNTLIYLTKRS